QWEELHRTFRGAARGKTPPPNGFQRVRPSRVEPTFNKWDDSSQSSVVSSSKR
ncbi:hypothetical protein TNCV_4777401, partial [Trichonephila clavipes]